MASERGFRKHWRVPLIALLGGLLAFASSFLVAPTYQSSTRLIIHGRDANFLSADGQSNANQPTITDSSQAKALADTYGSIATSRSLAIAVVDDLHLDAPSHKSGLLHSIASGFATAYRCGRAFVTAGFCGSVNRREEAIGNVQTGTTALQLGTTAGDSAGEPGSYVLEITSSGDSPAQAQAITNAVANELVKASTRQVQQSSAGYVSKLSKELDRVNAQVTAKTAEITSYEKSRHISAADQQLVVMATSYNNQRTALHDAKADLVEAEGQLTALLSAIATTPATSKSEQQINTGRSNTSVTTDQTNPTYSALVTQEAQTRANISGLHAKISTLEDQVAAGSPTTLNGPLARLSNLQQELTNAQQSQTDLTAQLQQAQTQLATAQPALTRIDTAGKSQYPVSPKRYLYLLIGLLLGALTGGAMTWLAGRRRPTSPVGPSDPDGHDDARTYDDANDTTEFSLHDLGEFRSPELEPVGAHANSNGANGRGASGQDNGTPHSGAAG